MNIFVLDYDPKQAAIYVCNKHVNKMCVESAQMLCVAVSKVYDWQPYRLTHINHKCTRWVCESKQNAEWLLSHLSGLLDEYTARYGKIHKVRRCGYEDFFDWHIRRLPNIGLTKHAVAVKEDCIKDDVVESYREYYRKYKKFAKWPSESPWWYYEQ